MSRTEVDEAYQKYLDLRDLANVDWQRLSQLTAMVAEQFMTDSPHGGDIHALQATFVSATQKTREAVAQYRSWLIKQQGG